MASAASQNFFFVREGIIPPETAKSEGIDSLIPPGVGAYESVLNSFYVSLLKVPAEFLCLPVTK